MGQTAAVYKRGLAHCRLQAGMSLSAAVRGYTLAHTQAKVNADLEWDKEATKHAYPPNTTAGSGGGTQDIDPVYHSWFNKKSAICFLPCRCAVDSRNLADLIVERFPRCPICKRPINAIYRVKTNGEPTLLWPSITQKYTNQLSSQPASRYSSSSSHKSQPEDFANYQSIPPQYSSGSYHSRASTPYQSQSSSNYHSTASHISTGSATPQQSFRKPSGHERQLHYKTAPPLLQQQAPYSSMWL